MYTYICYTLKRQGRNYIEALNMEPKVSQMPNYATTPPAQAVFKTLDISQIFIENVACAGTFSGFDIC